MRTARRCLVVGALVATAASAAGCGAGDSAPGWLAVNGVEITANDRLEARAAGRLLPPRGVFVQSFLAADSPARRAGLVDSGPTQKAVQHSDVIETIDGATATAEMLDYGPLKGHKAGDVVTLQVWAPNGSRRTVKVKLAEDHDSGGGFPGG